MASAPRPEPERGAHTLEVFRGEIVGLFGDDVFVELGPRMQGVISRRKFAEPPREGEVFEFTLRGQEEGLWALALREHGALASWESLERGNQVEARAVRAVHGGLELKIGPLHAFMPKSETGLAREQRPDVLVGKQLLCEVLEVDARRQRCFLSRKRVLQRERESEHQRSVGALRPGQVVQGRVTRLEPFGAFVRFERDLEGLVHVSNVAHRRVAHPGDVLHKGDAVVAKVLKIGRAGKRIALGIKQMDMSPWHELEQRLGANPVVAGTVTRVLDYGAFVAVPSGVEGLLHRSECGLVDGRPLRTVLGRGQSLSVRILAVDPERERLSLSLLHADGRRIAADEAAASAQPDELGELTELADATEPERRGTSLGPHLRRALGEGA
jgi:small subunit ribosomal protein S1